MFDARVRRDKTARNMDESKQTGLSGLRIALFEARFKVEFANLVRKQGGEPVVGPTMVEAPLELGDEVRAFVSALRAGEVDALFVLTGVGQRKLATLVEPILPREEFRTLLEGIVVAARGPKAVGGLKDLGVKPNVTAPEPHTWQDLLAAAAAYMPLAGKRVALQQYGVPHEKLTRALEQAGAQVLQVPVYRWTLPDDLEPLHHVIDEICAGRVEAVLFTSGPQVGSMVEVAARRGQETALRAGLSRMAIGSVGPTCTEAMRNLEIEPDFEPEHGKMGHLVLEAARKVRQVLAHKRAVSS
jgi:uroporphyrinogen-III synthase